MGPPSGGSAGPPDRQTLRLLERQLQTDPLVSAVAFDPDPYEPRLLRGVLDASSYPDPVETARIELRWFSTDDFSIHYVEQWADGDTWECRWDRHPNPHNARVHVHEPPAGADVTDLDLSSLHPLDVYSTVMTAIEQRIESVWEG